MAQKVALGLDGEALAEKKLRDDGFEIIEVGNSYSSYDMIAKKKGKTFAINVKTGKNFLIKPQNIARLLYLYSKYGHIPTFLLQDGDEHVCFTLATDFERLWHSKINEVGVHSNKYATLGLPKELVDEIDKIVGKHGFTSRAEIAKEAIRALLKEYEQRKET